MQVAPDILDGGFRNLILKTESDDAARSFANVDNRGGAVPATGVFSAWRPEEINLFSDL
jgi:hypothetical protein